MTEITRERTRLGRRGEKLARKYLQKSGYKHLVSNFAAGHGEIDMIMQDGEAVVFVEVKTRREEEFVKGEELIHYRKRRNMASATRHFIQRYQLQDRPCRFDTVVVIVPEEGKPTIRHREHAFQMPK